MKRSYYIMLSLKAPGGYQCFGQYQLGSDKVFAEGIFSQLRGSGTITEHPRLHMDLVEEAEGLPVTVKTICCTLDQFTGNCKHLAKEIFRLHTLNELL
ncbi:MAG TPA: hypothetical protein VHB54_21360 [Mucilaginibacter sp.]|nr:hypothetical protein [Mucilaginibacter sp.]HVW16396.1 hypothetical protein [Mucilaginibacter sp.]